MNKTISISIPETLLTLIEDVKDKRSDPTRSDTVRVLLLQALGNMTYLGPEEKKALGIKEQ